MKKLLAAVLLVLLAGAGWFAWQHRSPQTTEQTIPDNLIAKVEKRDIDFSIEVSGDVTPASQLEVKPEVGGRLISLHVEAGQTVKEGELLVEIDDRDLLSEKESVLTEIEGEKLSVDKTQKNFARAEELSAAKLISRESFDNLSSELAL